MDTLTFILKILGSLGVFLFGMKVHERRYSTHRRRQDAEDYGDDDTQPFCGRHDWPRHYWFDSVILGYNRYGG